MKGNEKMKLYKNVDICDLESILQNGLLSMKESGNYNWDSGRRANNSDEVVYLFKPLSEVNSFPKYGAALIEVEVDDFKNSALDKKDVNVGSYEEYITDRVLPSQFIKILIPEIFKNKLNLSEEVESKITWCDFSAKTYQKVGTEIVKIMGEFYEQDKLELVDMSQEEIDMFVNTAKLDDTGYDLYFRGLNENGEVFDVYDIKYIF